MSTEQQSASAPAGVRQRGLLVAAAVCAAVTVANIYLAQPVVGVVAKALGVPQSVAAWVATGSMFGYALGILFIVPLGDRLNRRRMVKWLTAVTSALLVGAAAANSVPLLAVLTGLVAITTVVPQVLVPLVVQNAGQGGRASAMAWVQAGLIVGIMGSRVLDSQLAQLWGWRAPYLVAAGLTLVVGQVTAWVLPTDQARPAGNYLTLLASLPGYLRREPDLRWACLRQAGTFAAFNAVWATIALALTAPPHGLSVGTAGLVGLLGLISAPFAYLAGRLTDRRGPVVVAGMGLVVLLVSIVPLVMGGHVLAGVLIGVVTLPIGLQITQVANQSASLSVDVSAGGRLNTIFMLTTFLAGAVGSELGAVVYGAAGWFGVCMMALVGLVIGSIGLAVPALRTTRPPRHRAHGPGLSMRN